MDKQHEDYEGKGRMILITGGARSGKSAYAEREALSLTSSPVYVATARLDPSDKEFAERIRRHQSDRNEQWINMEEQLHVSRLPLENKVAVIDCITLWLSNFFSLYKFDAEKSLQAIKTEIDVLRKTDAFFFIVSNEIGMGVHAETEAGRKFTDLQGWTNQYIASVADKVVLMVSGIPMTIKDLP